MINSSMKRFPHIALSPKPLPQKCEKVPLKTSITIYKRQLLYVNNGQSLQLAAPPPGTVVD